MANQESGDNKDKKITAVDKKALPICCPVPEKDLWNQHPRVYISLDDSGYGCCPYCGNQFQLEH